MVSTAAALQSTTQKYLELYDITNDLLMLQDGTCSLILKTSAINFDLFSEEEQDATIYAYAALLNSLSFPIEIVVRSQKKDVTSYLDLLKDQEVKAYTPLKKKQIREYRAFVEQLVQERNVLDKKFYLVLTASGIEMGLVSPQGVVPVAKKTTQPTFDKFTVIEKALTILLPRRDHLMHQLARIGLYSEQLKTQELIQLFYSIYNPEALEGQKIVNTNDYTTPLVQASLRVAPEVAPQVPVTPVEPAIQGAAPTTPQQNPQPTAPVPQPASSVPQPSAPPTPMQAPVQAPIPQPVMPPQPNTPAPSPSISSIKEDSFTVHTDLTPPTPPTQ